MSDRDIEGAKSNGRLPFILRLGLFLLTQLILVGVPFLFMLWLAGNENFLTVSLRWFIGIFVMYALVDGLTALAGGASETKQWRLRNSMKIWTVAFVLNFPLQAVTSLIVTR